MSEKKYPLIRYYEPMWCDESSYKPCYYQLAVENDFLRPIIQTPDYDTWKGDWVVLEEVRPEGWTYLIQRQDPPLGYFYVMFIESDASAPLDPSQVVFETFLAAAPSPGHLLNIDGKFYDITDCTWTIEPDWVGTTAECYLMVEVVMIGDAEKMMLHQKENDAVLERRKSFVVHDFEKKNPEDAE